MFSGIRKLWREARATELRKEVEDSVQRLRAAGDEVNLRFALQLVGAIKATRAQFGPLENMSDDGKLNLAKNLKGLAREAFDSNMGQGYALFVFSALVEAQALPGPDAKFVHQICQALVVAAVEVSDNFDAPHT